jgi:hypothetical protein
MQVIMSDNLEPLVLDLIEWVAKESRPYAEVMEAWRTSCPRLPVWEDAVDRGFVERKAIEGQGLRVAVTPSGQAFLKARRPSCCS